MDSLASLVHPCGAPAASKTRRVLSNGVLIPAALRQYHKRPFRALMVLAEREGFEPSKGYQPLLP